MKQVWFAALLMLIPFFGGAWFSFCLLYQFGSRVSVMSGFYLSGLLTIIYLLALIEWKVARMPMEKAK